MGRISWRYNSFCLVRFSRGRRRIIIPLPLALAQDFIEAVCWILYLLLRISPGLRRKIFRKKKIAGLGEKDLLQILKLPPEIFRELRQAGSMILMRIKDDEFYIEIRMI